METQHSYGFFESSTNMIAIAYKDYCTKNDYKKALLNELFSHQVMEQNLKMKNSKSKWNLQLTVSSSPEMLTNIMEEARRIVDDYKFMIARGLKNLNEEENLRLNSLMEVVNDYEPRKFPMSPEEYQRAIKYKS